jgi:hypothetical protein
MGHPALENNTPYQVEPLILADEEGRPIVVVVAKGTFDVAHGRTLVLAAEQEKVCLTGTFNGEPGKSSPRLEPETAFAKPATDVVLLGTARAPRQGTTEMDVELSVGRLRKTVHVTGDRVWFRSLGTATASRPVPFERIALSYENAFGGWDRSHEDLGRHAFEPRNPCGTGFRARTGRWEEGVRLPNLEDPKRRITSPSDAPPPCGVGFTAPDWEPRRGYAGTYDGSWAAERLPLLPRDFDRRFFNAASEGLVASGHLRGDEEVRAIGVRTEGPLVFRLPALPPPRVVVAFRRAPDARPPAVLDTVILDTDAARLCLLWRASAAVSGGDTAGVAGVSVACP